MQARGIIYYSFYLSGRRRFLAIYSTWGERASCTDCTGGWRARAFGLRAAFISITLLIPVLHLHGISYRRVFYCGVLVSAKGERSDRWLFVGGLGGLLISR